jgi:deoxycytidylate deaminase
VLGTGRNGVESGAPHCNEQVEINRFKVWSDSESRHIEKINFHTPHACAGAKMASGMGLDQCDAIHAEQNALLQCHDVFEIDTCYVTDSPCVHCVKLLMGTSCRRIVFRKRYAHDEPARLKWLKKNGNVQNVQREWIHIPGPA